jgi:hypothetical protein
VRKIIPVVAAGATTLALAGTTFGYANLNKDVTLSIDGQTSHVRTSADSVGALLKTKGIEVNGHDLDHVDHGRRCARCTGHRPRRREAVNQPQREHRTAGTGDHHRHPEDGHHRRRG